MTPTRSLLHRGASGFAALALSLGGAVGVIAVTAAPASADTINVTNTADDGTSTSLRSVLESANDGDVVVLTAGATYELTICEEPLPVIKEGSSGYGDVEIDGAVTIEGNGATIEQTCDDRVLYTEDDLTLRNVTVTGGVEGSDGGGLWSGAGLVLEGVTFTGNEAEGHGGGVYNEGSATVSGSTFTQNVADSNIGGFGGGGGLYAAGPATVSGSTFTQNRTTGTGGESAGGALASSGETLSIDTSTFTDNLSLRSSGGAIVTARGVESDAVGDGGVISINRTTISANGSPVGGGYSNVASDAAITITNSTITGNTTSEDGAIAASAEEATGVSLTLVNDTITNNVIGVFEQPDEEAAATDADAPSSSAGAAQLEVSTLSVVDGTFHSFGTVITGDGENDDCDVSGSVASQGYNYGDDDTCSFDAATDKASAPSPQLGALAANGGPTQTQLPSLTSPLLDAIPPAACQVTIDQRGITRPQGTGCEIGSVEIEVAAAPAAAVVTPRFTG